MPGKYMRWKRFLARDTHVHHRGANEHPKEKPVQADPTIADNTGSAEESLTTTHCPCCCTLLAHPISEKRLKCLTCDTHIDIDLNGELEHELVHEHELEEVTTPVPTCKMLKGAIHHDEHSGNDAYTSLDGILIAFSNAEILNAAFLTHHQKLDTLQLSKFYHLLIRLPSQRPVYKLLSHAQNLLIHPPHSNSGKSNWLVIILLFPFLPSALSSRSPLSPRFATLCFDILTRAISILANTGDQHPFHYIPTVTLKTIADLANRTISHHLTRLHTHLSLDECNVHAHIPSASTANNVHYMTILPKKFTKSSTPIPIGAYTQSWQLRNACLLLQRIHATSRINDEDCYNAQIQLVATQQDFDVHIFNKTFTKTSHPTSSSPLPSPSPSPSSTLYMETHRLYLGITVRNGVYTRSPFTICDTPIVIPLSVKSSILLKDVKKIQDSIAEDAFLQSPDINSATGTFKITVRRDHILADTLSKVLLLSTKKSEDLRKSFKVSFLGEPGVDAGGLRKEWFSLITEALFSQEIKIINYDNDAGVAWFHGNTVACGKKQMQYLYMLGVVMGLAVQNGVLLAAPFPQVVYKKLLRGGHSVNVDDLRQVDPVLARSLKKLLKMEGVEELGLTFEVSSGDTLIENGGEVSVNDENKNDYVHRYAQYVLTDCISVAYDEFEKGFHAIVSSPALNLFTPHELQQLVVGDACASSTKKLDVGVLRAIATYVDCDENDNVVKWWWGYLSDADAQKQRSVMRFVTGSDRIPAAGIAACIFRVTLGNGGNHCERLPVAHTCFNEVCLWNWESEQMLRQKMDLAVEESEGFALK